ncbi:hydrolase YafV [Prevotella sp. CAG:1185]|nr:hydrolase YafV [Prevotella sp. CAG:1185]
MKVTILQTDIKWAQPNENQVAANRLISNSPGSDLYVLPEMWSTGFITNPKKFSKNINFNESLDWMKETAQSNHCVLCGSLSITTPQNQYKNRLYFVLPNGDYYYYDKHHLFSYGGEDIYYTAGTARTVVQYNNISFLLQTCYDLRFPIWMRNNEDYDAIIVVANWPKNRRYAWDILLRARAIENQCYVIGSNRIGCDEQCSYDGGSAIVDAKGNILSIAENSCEQTITAEIDIQQLHSFRSKFPVLKDRDKFNII